MGEGGDHLGDGGLPGNVNSDDNGDSDPGRHIFVAENIERSDL